jgi:hypothetical protein
MQIRETLMDLFAYRDDSYLSASRPYFNEAGIVWMALGALWKGEAVNAGQMAETMASRGYDVEEFEIAIQAAMELGWVEQANRQDTFRLTAQGKQLRERAEEDTNVYFFAPWSVLSQDEIDELHELLARLYNQLKVENL